MLACYVTANLWEGTYVSVNVLQKNVVCITFGQPLIRIPFVQEAIKHAPSIRQVIHSVYDKEDTFPLILHYQNDGRKYYHAKPHTNQLPVGVKALTGTLIPPSTEPEMVRGLNIH